MSSVHYLNPGTSAWTERTSEDTHDLVQDPFWRIRQSTNASSSAIVLRCGLGFVKRSTNGGSTWSTITPSTNPPNSGGDSPAPTATTVTYEHMDASWVNQGTFIVLANWQNTSNVWRSWIAVTDDDGSTWTWTAIPAQEPGFTEYGINYILDATYTGKSAWAFNMSGDANTGTFIAANGAEVYLCSYDGTTEPAVEDIVAPGSIKDILRLSSTRFAVITQATYMTMYLYSISSDTITLEDSDGFPSRYEDVAGNTLRVRFLGIDDATKAMFIVTRTLYQRCDIGRVTFTSDTIAWPAGQTAWNTSFGNYPPYLHGDAVVSATNSAIFVWTQQQVSQLPFVRTALYATVCDYNAGGNPTFGSDYTIDSTWFQAGYNDSLHPHECIVRLSSTPEFLCTWSDGGSKSVMGLSVSGTVITAGTPASIGPSHFPNPIRVSDSHAFVIGNRYASLISIDGSLAATEVQGNSTYAGDAAGTSNKRGMALALNTPSLMAQVWTTTSSSYGGPGTVISFFEVVTEGGGAADVKSLGVSMGKSTETYSWVTAFMGDVLKLLRVTMSSMALGQYDLGSATLSEVNGGSKRAIPFVPYGSDTLCYIGGRMAEPQSLATIEHVIYTDDGGTSFYSIENGWGSASCGSLFALYDGTIYAIKNDNTLSMLYLGNYLGLTPRSVLPFPGVEAHGFAIDGRDAALVSCSRIAGSTMVAISPLPYVLWYDVTANHGTSEGINAVAIL